MNENARKKIEENIEKINYKIEHVYPYPKERTLAMVRAYEINSAKEKLDIMQKHDILKGIKFGLEKALEIIDEEENKDE